MQSLDYHDFWYCATSTKGQPLDRLLGPTITHSWAHGVQVLFYCSEVFFFWNSGANMCCIKIYKCKHMRC